MRQRLVGRLLTLELAQVAHQPLTRGTPGSQAELALHLHQFVAKLPSKTTQRVRLGSNVLQEFVGRDRAHCAVR